MAKYNLNFVGFLFVATIAVASCTFCALDYQHCGANSDVVKSVSINASCSGDKEAELQKGTNVMINYTFVPEQGASELESFVYGKISGLPYIPFPLSNPDACKDSGVTCPISAGQTYQYLPVLGVLSSFPSVKAEVKWELKDKDGNEIFCVTMVATIVGE